MTIQSKTTVNQELILAARRGLIPVKDHAMGGFGNMLRKELGQWWGTRTWWIQLIIWVLILNGVSTIVALTEYGIATEKLQEVVQTFLPMAVGLVAIGTVIAAQGAVVGEKELGTAAWVLSKPASRSAFILAKLVANALNFWITSLIFPATIFFIEMRLLIPMKLSLPLFLGGLAVAILSQLFYNSLTLMLGTLFKSRGPITAIGIGIILTGLLLKSMIPLQIMIATPWVMPDLSAAIALGAPLPVPWFVPIAFVGVEILVMIVIALWRFGKEEF